MTGLLWKCFAFVGAVLVVASVANASSYLRLDGVVVDPIQYSAGSGSSGNHLYTGPNLEPGVQAPGADLSGADLTLAALDHANFSDAFFGWWADFSGADLSFANLSNAIACCGADFSGANLSNADFSTTHSAKNAAAGYLANANLTNTNLSGRWLGDSPNANFTNANFFGSSVGGDFTNAIFVAADLSNTLEGLQYVDLTGATYSTGSLSNRTLFPAGFDPVAAGMVLVPEVSTGLMVGIGLLGMAFKGKTRKRVR